jgi:hypothetical protein
MSADRGSYLVVRNRRLDVELGSAEGRMFAVRPMAAGMLEFGADGFTVTSELLLLLAAVISTSALTGVHPRRSSKISELALRFRSASKSDRTTV